MAKLCAPVLLGLEGIAADELRRLDFQNVKAENGRVLFDGDLTEAARANLWLRTAERVHILAAEFEAPTFDALFEGVKAAPLEQFIPADGAFLVKGRSVRSALASIPDCQRIIKKAAAVRLEKAHGKAMRETGGKYQLQFTILKDVCSLYIDTTGEPLHKRGYRAQSVAAPLRETLAAALVYLSKRRGDRPLCDPFCGSGTILIEAGMMAANMAPGMRRRFAVEGFAGFDAAAFERIKREARESVREFSGEITGSDIDPEAVELARLNAAKAGLAGKIGFEVSPFSSAKLPESGIIITNPPYGERMGDIESARRLYAELGRRVRERESLGVYVLSPDERFERFFGRRADKKRKLYNGMIKCELFMFMGKNIVKK
jgi:putative N6-adenine-specific DNA methylase